MRLRKVGECVSVSGVLFFVCAERAQLKQRQWRRWQQQQSKGFECAELFAVTRGCEECERENGRIAEESPKTKTTRRENSDSEVCLCSAVLFLLLPSGKNSYP